MIGFQMSWECMSQSIIGLMQERRDSSANALELHLSCINPLKSQLWHSKFSPNYLD